MTHIESYVVVVGERGRVVLPAALRRRLSIRPGDRLILTVEPEGTCHLVSAREQAGRLLGMYQDLAPGRSLTDELIAERREEARREDAE
jgi:AbrB family looped-hinge helix DNA binding protein